MKYRPEVDGLRAVAVIPVILFHAGFPAFAGGFIGVDIFFVISGFLITTILVTELDQGRFSIADFYERRARRILPALFFVLACCMPFAWLWMLPDQFLDFSNGMMAVVLFASNILFWREADYFAPATEENPLIHTWSLAVEEQFYIFFPILLLILWRLGRRSVLPVVVVLCLCSLAVAEWASVRYPAANFYLLPSRAWELGIGAICALLLKDRGPVKSEVGAALGMLLVLGSMAAFDKSTPFPSLWAVFPVAGAAMVIAFGASDTVVGRLLSARPMVAVGLLSYSAYLWHQPLFAFARVRLGETPPASLMLGLSVLALVLAVLSWRFVERPFRRAAAGPLRTRKSVFAASGVAMTLLVAVGAYGHVTDGRAAIWSEGNPSLAPTYWMVRRAVAETEAAPTRSRRP